MNMVIVWLVMLIIFVVAEGATTSLVSIWFALGALGALLIAVILPNFYWLQIIVFLIISALTLYFTRPIAQKYLNSRTMKTNADRVLDMTGVVKEEIDNIAGTGSVFIGGKLWTARSEKGVVIPENTLVTVSNIEGVKLIVNEQLEKKEEAI